MKEWFTANPAHKFLAQDLIDADITNFGHINLNQILFLEIKEIKPRQLIVIKKINEPFVMLLGKIFYIAINEELMAELDQEHKELNMLRILLHIDKEEGKMRFPEVFEFRCILNHFGPDWQTTQIPSALDMMKNGTQII